MIEEFLELVRNQQKTPPSFNPTMATRRRGIGNKQLHEVKAIIENTLDPPNVLFHRLSKLSGHLGSVKLELKLAVLKDILIEHGLKVFLIRVP